MSAALGILSTAHLHAHAYADLIAERSDVELVGVADGDAERGSSFAGDHGTTFFDDAESLLDRVDGVVVCSTNADHRSWVRAAADAGVHVLSEKPLAPSVDEAESIVGACREAGVELGVAMPLRFSLPLRRAKEAFEAGDLGELRTVVGTNRGQMPGGWFVDPGASGGGAVMDHTVHIVDVVHWLTGERVAEVYAETGTRFHDLSVEDINLLSMTLADGTTFSLDGSWSKPDEWDFWGDATLELVGTEGVATVDCFDQKLKHTSDADGGIRSIYWGPDPNGEMIADFAAAIADGRPPETTGRDGVEAVAVVEAAYESARRGEAVPVDY